MFVCGNTIQNPNIIHNSGDEVFESIVVCHLLQIKPVEAGVKATVVKHGWSYWYGW